MWEHSIMSDKDVAEEPEAPDPDEPVPGAGRPTSREPFIPPGPVSTKDLRERARRRLEAEEKLRQRLLQAKEKPAEE
jgi:hypothetical protein